MTIPKFAVELARNRNGIVDKAEFGWWLTELESLDRRIEARARRVPQPEPYDWESRGDFE